MAYSLEGRLLEVCDCKTLCPCWVGDDPDNGSCKGALSWHFDKGNIDGVDVTGLTFALLCDIPGNILKGNWKVIAYVDEKASKAQEEAILAVYTGKKGGPVYIVNASNFNHDLYACAESRREDEGQREKEVRNGRQTQEG